MTESRVERPEDAGVAVPIGSDPAAATSSAAPRLPGRLSRRLSVSTRASLAIVGVTIACLVVTALVGLARVSSSLSDAFEARLATINAARSNDLGRYMEGLHDRVVALSASPGASRAIVEFAGAMDELDTEPVSQELVDDLTTYYLDVVLPPLAAARGEGISQTSLLPITNAALRLQSTWTISEDGRDPALEDDADDGTTWSAVHAEFHPAYRKLALQAGFDDLWLVDTDGRIVYSVDKGIDLGTNLEAGPHSGSVLSQVVADVLDDPVPGEVVVGDLAPSTTTGGRPMGALASPVFDDGRVVGVVAGSFTSDSLTRIMTDGGDWDGMGTTGQSYLAAGDDTMRSDDRLFLQDPQAWLEAAGPLLTMEQARSIEVLDTTVTFAPVDEHLVAAAAGGDPGFGDGLGTTGEEVLAALSALELDGLDWVAVTQVDRSEAELPVATFVRNLLIAIALFVVVVTFVGVAWANRFTQPLRAASDRLRRARTGGRAVVEQQPSTDMASDAASEYVELSSDIDVMLVRLAERSREVEQRSNERLELLRRFLPAAVVRRAEAGEQDVVDQVDHVSVAVVVVHGLGELVREGDKDQARDLLARLVDDLDAVAQANGLERLRVDGDSYHAVAGASRPLLDHAPRAAGFGLEARNLVAELGDEVHWSLAVGVGLASGPMTVGLTIGARLVFDGWGPTVDRAGKLARAAAPGQVLAHVSTTSNLPEDFVTHDPGVDDEILELSGKGATHSPGQVADQVTGSQGS